MEPPSGKIGSSHFQRGSDRTGSPIKDAAIRFGEVGKALNNSRSYYFKPVTCRESIAH